MKCCYEVYKFPFFGMMLQMVELRDERRFFWSDKGSRLISRRHSHVLPDKRDDKDVGSSLEDIVEKLPSFLEETQMPNMNFFILGAFFISALGSEWVRMQVFSKVYNLFLSKYAILNLEILLLKTLID